MIPLNTYTYHQSQGWSVNESNLIGYQTLAGNYINDLWLETTNPNVENNAYYQRINYGEIELKLEKYLNANSDVSSMIIYIDFYSELPTAIKGQYHSYSSRDLDEFKICTLTYQVGGYTSSKNIYPIYKMEDL